MLDFTWRTRSNSRRLPRPSPADCVRVNQGCTSSWTSTQCFVQHFLCTSWAPNRDLRTCRKTVPAAAEPDSSRQGPRWRESISTPEPQHDPATVLQVSSPIEFHPVWAPWSLLQEAGYLPKPPYPAIRPGINTERVATIRTATTARLRCIVLGHVVKFESFLHHYLGANQELRKPVGNRSDKLWQACGLWASWKLGASDTLRLSDSRGVLLCADADQS